MDVGISFRCLLMGHEDLIARESDRIYLECCDCGRRTVGWQLARTERRLSSREERAKGRTPQFAAA